MTLLLVSSLLALIVIEALCAVMILSCYDDGIIGRGALLLMLIASVVVLIDFDR